ncbi:hypothetical protein PAPHI01_1900 [Pancytospora philotis]|nr:hypothetical protein PAPHI01_1900 [Pancytospora philotis]
MFYKLSRALVVAREVYHLVYPRLLGAAEQAMIDDQDIYKQLRSIARLDYFSKIHADINDGQPIILNNFSAQPYDVDGQNLAGRKSVINFLPAREFYLKHEDMESTDVWSALNAVASKDAHVSRLLSGLQLVVTTHRAVFYTSYYGWYSPNLRMLEPAYDKRYRNNLDELYAVYKAAVAALRYSQSRIPTAVLELSAKIIERDAAKLKERGHPRHTVRNKMFK